MGPEAGKEMARRIEDQGSRIEDGGLKIENRVPDAKGDSRSSILHPQSSYTGFQMDEDC
jgi:hypothetical protein